VCTRLQALYPVPRDTSAHVPTEDALMSPDASGHSAVAAGAIDYLRTEPSLVVHALRQAANDPGRLAVLDGTSIERFTRGELAARSALLAARLSERGIGRGDLVAVAMPSSVWWPVVALGAWRAGAALAPVSPLWTASETGRVLAYVRPSIAVAFGESVSVVRGALSAACHPIDVLVHDVAPETTPCTPLARLLASADGDPLADPEIQPSDLAAVLLSKVTGGPPKVVRLTHGELAAVAAASANALGILGSFCAALHAGAPLVTAPTSDTERVLEPPPAVPA
jgi:acyl-CoA synthetase (AMP-forming)/AMP-acid ligase II